MTAHRRLGFNRMEFRKRLQREAWERNDALPKVRINFHGGHSEKSLAVWIRFYWFNHLRYMYPIGEVKNPGFDYRLFKLAMRELIMSIRFQPKPRLP